jgi:hypothetical protein
MFCVRDVQLFLWPQRVLHTERWRNSLITHTFGVSVYGEIIFTFCILPVFASCPSLLAVPNNEERDKF